MKNNRSLPAVGSEQVTVIRQTRKPYPKFIIIVMGILVKQIFERMNIVNETTGMQVFAHPAFGEVRTVSIDGEPWFVGKDVAQRLGHANPQRAIHTHVDDEDKTVTDSVTVNGTPVLLINESGLYSLIMSSKLPSAKAFKRWVTSEVLPALRQQGSYAIRQPMTPAQLIAAQAQVLVQMEEKMQALQAQTEAVRDQQTALEAKVETAIKAFARPNEDHWRRDMDEAIKGLCQEKGLNLMSTKGRMFRELEQKCGCDVDARQRRLRQRMRKQGARKRDLDCISKLDAIGADRQLRAVFESIVREWQVRTAVVEGQQEIVVQDSFDLAEGGKSE